MLAVKVGEVIEETEVDLGKKETGRIKNIRRRLKIGREKLIRHKHHKNLKTQIAKRKSNK